MIAEDKKKRIESLSTDEMLFEINLGTKSRFQREKFAYLQTCYQKRIEQNELINKLESLNLEDVKQNLRQFKYQNHEVPHVKEWIHEQDLRLRQQPIKQPVTKTNDTEKINEKLELDTLIIRYRSSSIQELKKCLESGLLESWKIPYIEELIEQKENEAINAPTFMYHRSKAPKGQVFKAHEALTLERKGWVDSPAKFREGFFEKIYRLVIGPLFKFWCKEYKWILGFIATLITLYLAYLKIIKPS